MSWPFITILLNNVIYSIPGTNSFYWIPIGLIEKWKGYSLISNTKEKDWCWLSSVSRCLFIPACIFWHFFRQNIGNQAKKFGHTAVDEKLELISLNDAGKQRFTNPRVKRHEQINKNPRDPLIFAFGFGCSKQLLNFSRVDNVTKLSKNQWKVPAVFVDNVTKLSKTTFKCERSVSIF